MNSKFSQSNKDIFKLAIPIKEIFFEKKTKPKRKEAGLFINFDLLDDKVNLGSKKKVINYKKQQEKVKYIIIDQLQKAKETSEFPQDTQKKSLNFSFRNAKENMNPQNLVKNTIKQEFILNLNESANLREKKMPSFNKKENEYNLHLSVRENTVDYIGINNSLCNHNCEIKRVLNELKNVEDSLSLEEDEEDIKENKNFDSIFFIFPKSKFKIIWNIMIYFSIAYTLITIPILIAFRKMSRFLSIEIFIDFLFILDMIFNFFVPFYNFDDKIVLNHVLVCKNYIQTWFLYDLISSIPISFLIYFLEIYGNNASSLDIFRLIKLLKLMKINDINDETFKTFSYFKNNILFKNLNLKSSEIRLIEFLLWMIISSHILSCIWIYLTIFSGVQSTWLSIFHFSNQIDIYICSFYFTWTTIFTIGYGDVVSVSNIERIYNVLLMSFGVCVYSFALSSVSNIITGNDEQTEKFLNSLSILDEIKATYRNFDDETYKKIYNFIKFEHKNQKNQKYTFIGDLPTKLRNELLNNMYKRIIESFFIFKNTSKSGEAQNQEFNSKIVLNMRPIKLTKGDVIVNQGYQLQEMFLIHKGVFIGEYYYGDVKLRICNFRKNDHFGDVLCLSNTTSQIRIKVKSKDAEIFVISKNDLIKIIEEFPQIWEPIFSVSVKNYERIEKLIKNGIDKINKKTVNYDKEFEEITENNLNSISTINNPEGIKSKVIEFQENENIIIDSEFKSSYNTLWNNENKNSKSMKNREIFFDASCDNLSIKKNLDTNFIIKSQNSKEFTFANKTNLKIIKNEYFTFEGNIKRSFLRNLEINSEFFALNLRITANESNTLILKSLKSINSKKFNSTFHRDETKIHSGFETKRLSKFAKNNFLTNTKKNTINKNKFERRKSVRILQSVNEHLETNAFAEKDPLSFIAQEISKIEKKVIDNQKGEMNRMIEKIDDLFNVLKNLKNK